MPCFEEVAVALVTVAIAIAGVGHPCLDHRTCCCSVAIAARVVATLAVVDLC